MTALVIGVGHPYRRDDSIGPLVAGDIAALGLAGVEILSHHGEGTDLMARWRGRGRVVVVDATASGAEAGTIRVWDAVAAPLPAGLFPKGSHQFGLAEGIEMARLLGELPEALTVIGVEGVDFSAGEGLSPAVATALPAVVAEIRVILGQSEHQRV